MSWIRTISYENAEGALKSIYDRIKGPDNYIDNVLTIHSLRPHSLVGHMTLYKNVLHHSNNTLPKWYLEAIGVYVSFLNKCDYCIQHHSAGLKRLLQDQSRVDQFMESLQSNRLEDFFDEQYLKGMKYASKLTLEAPNIVEEDIEELRSSGFSDGEILEINQVVSYFNYVNRLVLGLGVDTTGDVLGLSPNEAEDPNDWSHQ